MVGPIGNWEVSQAQILNYTANAQGQAPHGRQPTHGAQTKHNSMVLGPKHKAAQQVSQVWRARNSNSDKPHLKPSLSPTTKSAESVVEEKPLERFSHALTTTTLRHLGSDTSIKVQIASDATKWLLRLWDGKSMVLPVVCPCGSGVTPRNDELD